MFMQTLIPNIVISILFILLFSTQSQASNFIKTNGKNWQVGVGGYAVVVDGYNDRNELSGNSLSVAFVLNDYVAVKGQYYSIDNEESKSYNFDLSGYDVNAYFGNNLQSNGFKYYSGIGFYKETLGYSSGDEDIIGAQISGGIGYNWSHVSLDLTLSYRTVGDYADYFDEKDDNVTAMSSSLTVAYRF
jgi:hypothetical protein